MISYFNKAKNLAAIVSTSLILNFASCVKTIPVNNFIKSETSSQIIGKEEVKNIKYKIKNVQYFYQTNTLEFQVNEIATKTHYDIQKKETYDIYEIGTKDIYDKRTAGLTTGIIGGITTFLIGIKSITNPPTKTECMDYYTSAGTETRCETENKTPVAGWLFTLLGPPSFALIGYGLSKIEKTYKEDLKKEKRKKGEKILKVDSGTENFYNKPIPNIPLQITSNYPFFNNNKKIKAKTNKKGKAAIKLTTPKYLTFKEEDIKNFSKIKQLREYEYDEEADKLTSYIKNNPAECSFTIQILKRPQTKESFDFECYKVPTKRKLEELIQ
jgi:hypothetical protein